jgi:uncharacterized damage-inducible protein DinB
MPSSSLNYAVEALASLTHSLADMDLDRAWAWGDYDSEGVRFAFFRVYEEMRTLAVKLAEARQASSRPPTAAQRILAHYHAAYRDLQAALLGVPFEEFDHPPAAGEWPLRQILAHIVGADAGFFAVVAHALSQIRSGIDEPTALTQAAYDAILGIDEATEEAILVGPVPSLQAFHAELHSRILTELAGIDDPEIEHASRYWETQPMGVRFRLHRFDSHMRQHTVQIDKALHDLGLGPTEARRLLRLIYAALAEAEGVLIGAADLAASLQEATAGAIANLTGEIAPLLELPRLNLSR